MKKTPTKSQVRPRLYKPSKASVFLANLKNSEIKFNFLKNTYVSFETKFENAYKIFVKHIINDDKRKNTEFKIGAVALSIIFLSSGTFTAATAYAPTVEESEFQTLQVSSDSAAPVISRDSISISYTARTNVDTYGPEVPTFVNNRGGAVQYPFMRGVPLSDGFGPRAAVCPEGCTETVVHQGQDFAAAEGAEIQAIADGVVIQVVNFKDNILEQADESKNDSGSFVKIQHNVNGETFISLYGHLQFKSSPLVEGQSVQVGDFVGKVGNTGVSTGPHLHFGIQLNGKWIDPMPFIAERNNISFLSAR